jgi:DNA-binding CsgD family transcriptional regulator
MSGPSADARWARAAALLAGGVLNGSFHNDLSVAEELLDDPRTPSELRGRFLASKAIEKAYQLHFDEGEFLARRALACSGDPSTEVRARSALCWTNLGRGRLQMAVDEGRQVGDVNQLATTESEQCFPWMYQALASMAVDDFTPAERCVASGRESARRAGLVDGVGIAQHMAAQLKLYAGDFQGALAESASAIGSPAVEALRQSVIATVRIHQGALEDARQHVVLAADLVADLDIRPVQCLVRLVQAQLWAAEGRPADGMALLDGLFRKPRRWVVLIVTDPSVVPTLVRLARDGGVPERARPLISLAELLAAANGEARSLRAAALHARGLLHDDVALLLEAVSVATGGSRRFATAVARDDAARALAARGDVDRATELYRGALEGYTAVGATLAARRVRSSLRGRGIYRMASQRRGRPDHGWASLSEAELEVVRLVAEGLTNRAVAERLFMSRHTVDSHLRHAFTKMGVTSRVVLTRLAIDQPDFAFIGHPGFAFARGPHQPRRSTRSTS